MTHKNYTFADPSKLHLLDKYGAANDFVSRTWDRSYILLNIQGTHSGASWISAKIHAAIQHVVSVYPVNPAQIYMNGVSFGGAAVIQYMIDFPTQVAAAYAGAPYGGGGFGSISNLVTGFTAASATTPDLASRLWLSASEDDYYEGIVPGIQSFKQTFPDVHVSIFKNSNDTTNSHTWKGGEHEYGWTAVYAYGESGTEASLTAYTGNEVLPSGGIYAFFESLAPLSEVTVNSNGDGWSYVSMDANFGDRTAVSSYRDISVNITTAGKTVFFGDSYVDGMRTDKFNTTSGTKIDYPVQPPEPLRRFGDTVVLGNGAGANYMDGIGALVEGRTYPKLLDGDPYRVIAVFGLNDIMWTANEWGTYPPLDQSFIPFISALRYSAPTAHVYIVFPFYYPEKGTIDTTNPGKCNYQSTTTQLITHEDMIRTRDRMIALSPPNVNIIDYFSEGCALAQNATEYATHYIDWAGHHSVKGQTAFLDFIHNHV